MDLFLSIPFLIFLPMAASFFVMSPLFTGNEIAIRRFTQDSLKLVYEFYKGGE